MGSDASEEDLWFPARSVLGAWTLGGYLTSRRRTARIATVGLDDTVEATLESLAARGVLSAPVVDREALTFVGFVDVDDILTALVHVLEGDSDTVVPDPEAPLVVLASATLETLRAKGAELALTSLLEIQGVRLKPEDGEMIFKGSWDATLLDVVSSCFFNPVQGHGGRRGVSHRCGVFKYVYDWEELDDAVAIDGIISHSDVVRLLHDEVAELGAPLAGASLEDLRLAYGSKPVLCCPEDGTRAIDAFAWMIRRGVSAVGVTGDDGRLVDTLSISDLRGLTTQKFELLAGSICDYLAAVRTRRVDRRLVTCVPTDTLETALRLLTNNNIHHLYVVDDDGAPVGMITGTDILSHCRSHTSWTMASNLAGVPVSSEYAYEDVIAP